MIVSFCHKMSDKTTFLLPNYPLLINILPNLPSVDLDGTWTFYSPSNLKLYLKETPGYSSVFTVVQMKNPNTTLKYPKNKGRFPE